jgi:long-chain acyl-CoA synthetase
MDAIVSAARQRFGIPDTVDTSAYPSLNAMFLHAVRSYPDKPAFTSLGYTLSFGELGRLSAEFAAYLQRHTNLVRGDRIAIQLPNLIQYPVVLFGALRAGLVVVNTNPLYTAREIEHQFQDSGVKALVVLANVAHTAAEVLQNTDIQQVIVTELADLHPAPRRWLINGAARYIKRMVPAFRFSKQVSLRKALALGRGASHREYQPAPDELAVLQYTGGTTGVAKGAELSHANLVANTLQCSLMFNTYGFGECTELMVVPLPLYHIYSFTLAMILLHSGNHMVLIPNPRDTDSLVKEMGRWPMTAFSGLNTLFVALCKHPKFAQVDFSRVRMTVSGGMALTAGAANEWRRITGTEIYEGYGLTETSPVVTVNPGGGNRQGSIGIPLPATWVKVIDEAGQALPTGEPGELCVRGPQVMKRYWRRPEETAKVLDAEGWLRTGDMAVIGEDGYVRIVDRKKDMIVVSGFNVYPNEVEDVLSQHPDVVEAAVVGVPDPVAGERIKAFVVPARDGVDPEALRAHCHAELAGYKVPKLIEFRADLPKSNVGKVLRRELRDGTA